MAFFALILFSFTAVAIATFSLFPKAKLSKRKLVPNSRTAAMSRSVGIRQTKIDYLPEIKSEPFARYRGDHGAKEVENILKNISQKYIRNSLCPACKRARELTLSFDIET